MDCLFCNIVSGKVPSLKLFEDDLFLAILDIKPGNPGHFIVFPKKHIPFLTEMEPKQRGVLFNIATEIGKRMVSMVEAEGFNIVYSAGTVAGQITPHMLVHVIPRFKDDKVDIKWEPVQVSEEMYKKLISAFSGTEEKKEEKKEEPPEEKNEFDELPQIKRRSPRYW